jgi:hypothetical protein
MFQKQLSTMAASMHELKYPGDFFLMPDPELTTEVLNDMLADSFFTALLEATVNWYRRPPAAMPRKVIVRAGGEDTFVARLGKITLSGAW